MSRAMAQVFDPNSGVLTLVSSERAHEYDSSSHVQYSVRSSISRYELSGIILRMLSGSPAMLMLQISSMPT